MNCHLFVCIVLYSFIYLYANTLIRLYIYTHNIYTVIRLYTYVFIFYSYALTHLYSYTFI